MPPDVRFLTPVRIAGHAAIGDDQGRRIGDPGGAVETQHVFIKHRLRQIVLDRRVAVGDETQIHVKERGAFGDDGDVFLDRRGGILNHSFRKLTLVERVVPLHLTRLRFVCRNMVVGQQATQIQLLLTLGIAWIWTVPWSILAMAMVYQKIFGIEAHTLAD